MQNQQLLLDLDSSKSFILNGLNGHTTQTDSIGQRLKVYHPTITGQASF
jgi:hypothetical protein